MAVGVIEDRDDFSCDGIEFKRRDDNTKEVFTSLVRLKGSKAYNVLPVKSSEEIEVDKFIEISKAISRIYVGIPVFVGDAICKNILNTGIDIIATKNIDH